MLSKSGPEMQGSLGVWGRQSGIWEMVGWGAVQGRSPRFKTDPRTGDGKPEVAERCFIVQWPCLLQGCPWGLGLVMITQFQIHPLPVGELRPWAYSFLQSRLAAGLPWLVGGAHQKMYLWGNRDGKNEERGQTLTPDSYFFWVREMHLFHFQGLSF